MKISRNDILRRIRYGDFAPWEMDEDDPGHAEFQVSPEDEKKRLKSLPLEKKDAEYFLHDYLPEKFGLNHNQTIKMASRYMDHHKMIHGYQRHLKEDLDYDTPKMNSMHEIIEHHRNNGFDHANIIGCIGGYLEKNKLTEDLHENLMHDAKMFKLTGKI